MSKKENKFSVDTNALLTFRAIFEIPAHHE